MRRGERASPQNSPTSSQEHTMPDEKITTETDLPGAAGIIASYAKLTANNSNNWENFELIVLDVLKAVYSAGQKSSANKETGQ